MIHIPNQRSARRDVVSGLVSTVATLMMLTGCGPTNEVADEGTQDPAPKGPAPKITVTAPYHRVFTNQDAQCRLYQVDVSLNSIKKQIIADLGGSSASIDAWFVAREKVKDLFCAGTADKTTYATKQLAASDKLETIFAEIAVLRDLDLAEAESLFFSALNAEMDNIFESCGFDELATQGYVETGLGTAWPLPTCSAGGARGSIGGSGSMSSALDCWAESFTSNECDGSPVSDGDDDDDTPPPDDSPSEPSPEPADEEVEEIDEAMLIVADSEGETEVFDTVAEQQAFVDNLRASARDLEAMGDRLRDTYGPVLGTILAVPAYREAADVREMADRIAKDLPGVSTPGPDCQGIAGAGIFLDSPGVTSFPAAGPAPMTSGDQFQRCYCGTLDVTSPLLDGMCKKGNDATRILCSMMALADRSFTPVGYTPAHSVFGPCEQVIDEGADLHCFNPSGCGGMGFLDMAKDEICAFVSCPSGAASSYDASLGECICPGYADWYDISSSVLDLLVDPCLNPAIECGPQMEALIEGRAFQTEVPPGSLPPHYP